MKRYVCPQCGWITQERENIVLHMALIHPELFDKTVFQRSEGSVSPQKEVPT